MARVSYAPTQQLDQAIVDGPRCMEFAIKKMSVTPLGSGWRRSKNLDKPARKAIPEDVIPQEVTLELAMLSSRRLFHRSFSREISSNLQEAILEQPIL